MLTVSILTKNPKTPVLDARSTNIKATKRPHVDFKALKRTHLQYSSPMETCAYHFTSTPASSMSHSTLSNVGLLAINSFQFSTYLLSPKTQWAITSSLHQLPGDLTFFTWLSKTHQSISSPSKFTSIWADSGYQNMAQAPQLCCRISSEYREAFPTPADPEGTLADMMSTNFWEQLNKRFLSPPNTHSPSGKDE
jgi:hypothetical protein